MKAHVYKIIAETVAYVEADSSAEAKAKFYEGESSLDDTEIKGMTELSQSEYQELLQIL